MAEPEGMNWLEFPAFSSDQLSAIIHRLFFPGDRLSATPFLPLRSDPGRRGAFGRLRLRGPGGRPVLQRTQVDDLDRRVVLDAPALPPGSPAERDLLII